MTLTQCLYYLIIIILYIPILYKMCNYLTWLHNWEINTNSQRHWNCTVYQLLISTVNKPNNITLHARTTDNTCTCKNSQGS